MLNDVIKYNMNNINEETKISFLKYLVKIGEEKNDYQFVDQAKLNEFYEQFQYLF